MVGMEKEATLGRPTLAELNRFAMILTVAEDNTIKISPWGKVLVEQIEGEQLDGSPWNIYREEPAGMDDNLMYKFFYLRYRYKAPAPNGSYKKDWVYVQEYLKKQE